MLSEEFLRNCVEMFPVLPRGLETNSRPFPQKHLNIIDPLKENNNLGRSVNRGRGLFSLYFDAFSLCMTSMLGDIWQDNYILLLKMNLVSKRLVIWFFPF